MAFVALAAMAGATTMKAPVDPGHYYTGLTTADHDGRIKAVVPAGTHGVHEPLAENAMHGNPNNIPTPGGDCESTGHCPGQEHMLHGDGYAHMVNPADAGGCAGTIYGCSPEHKPTPERIHKLTTKFDFLTFLMDAALEKYPQYKHFLAEWAELDAKQAAARKKLAEVATDEHSAAVAAFSAVEDEFHALTHKGEKTVPFFYNLQNLHSDLVKTESEMKLAIQEFHGHFPPPPINIYKHMEKDPVVDFHGTPQNDPQHLLYGADPTEHMGNDDTNELHSNEINQAANETTAVNHPYGITGTQGEMRLDDVTEKHAG